MSEHWQRDSVTEPDPLRRHEVELRMLAARQRVPGVRALATEMAMREDFDLDSIDDIRLAVDEACSIMLANSMPDTVLTVRLLITAARFEINASIPLRGDREPVVGSLSLSILRSLAETLDYWTIGIGDKRGFRLTFTRSTRQAASS